MPRSIVVGLVVGLVLGGCGERDRGGSDGGGERRDAASHDAAGGGGTCGRVTCGAGMVCCDHCTGSCIPEASGAMCPDDLDPGRACDGGGMTMTWTSCAEAHGRARDGDACTFSDTCGNCCCEGSTSCSDGRISTALCDCLCMPDDAGAR